MTVELSKAFPEAKIYTALYSPDRTYDDFRDRTVVTSIMNHVPAVRADPRLAFPLLPYAWRSLGVLDADIVICSTSGWSHAIRTTGSKIVYCHNPARWLYQPDAYFSTAPRLQKLIMRRSLGPLKRWDRAAMGSGDRFVANSRNVAERMSATYGRDATVIHPPRGLDPTAERDPLPGLAPGFYLTISRTRGYKRSKVISEAFKGTTRVLVQVGGERPETPNVVHLSGVTDAELRWLYANSRALVAVGDEDFGLTPVEAYAFGTPAVVLAAGGYLETSHDVSTVLVPQASASALSQGIERLEASRWDKEAIISHAAKWSPDVFRQQIRALVEDMIAGAAK